MKQSIVAIVRPNLNLSQKESQAAHLIEHILVEPWRLKTLGISDDFYVKNIIYNSGVVNDFYLAEYYVVRSEAADTIAKILLKYQGELYINRDDFEKTKSALIEEICESKGEFMDMSEQMSKAIYAPESPSIRNPWNDLESVVNLSYDKVVEIFHKYNTNIALMQLSFNKYDIDKLPKVEKNRLRKSDRTIELTHPWQSPDSLDISHLIPLPDNTKYIISLIYRRSLTDLHLGLLYNDLRTQQGLIYDISIDNDFNSNHLDMYFSSNEKTTKKVTEEINTSLATYEQFIKSNLNYIKERLKLEFELDWGDIQTSCLDVVDRVVSGGVAETPQTIIERIEKVTIEGLVRFNHFFLDTLNHRAIYVRRRHGKNVDTKFNA